jgi:hypothetical protein
MTMVTDRMAPFVPESKAKIEPLLAALNAAYVALEAILDDDEAECSSQVGEAIEEIQINIQLAIEQAGG